MHYFHVIVALVATAFVCAKSARAAVPELKLEDNGVFAVDGVKGELQCFGPNWEFSRQSHDVTARPAEKANGQTRIAGAPQRRVRFFGTNLCFTANSPHP